ncbi:unnamed protein product [Pleuronectes platessa]|uniref:Uncharacterized protein n=1 Tax=Pleuronectes platessa TaxID=8262 RepID=A0A9N7V1V1_PLEPL|nr:unnamed protein product [Pleuronectes platessa]
MCLRAAAASSSSDPVPWRHPHRTQWGPGNHRPETPACPEKRTASAWFVTNYRSASVPLRTEWLQRGGVSPTSGGGTIGDQLLRKDERDWYQHTTGPRPQQLIRKRPSGAR